MDGSVDRSMNQSTTHRPTNHVWWDQGWENHQVLTLLLRVLTRLCQTGDEWIETMVWQWYQTIEMGDHCMYHLVISVVISQTHWLVSQKRLFQSHHLVSGGSNFYSWCVTPHSSPSRGCWQCLTIFNILNIFIIINWIENRHIIAQYHYFAGFSLHSSPHGGIMWSHDQGFSLSLEQPWMWWKSKPTHFCSKKLHRGLSLKPDHKIDHH